MKLDTDRPYDLVAVAALTALLLVVIGLLPDSPLRTALGLPFILFFPGYALVAALFPERHREYEVQKGDADSGKTETVTEGLDPLERIALSFGLSIAVVPLLGLGLNYTPWGIRLVPILVSVSGFILLACAVAWWRRARIPADRRFRVRFEVHAPDWKSQSRLDKALTIGLALSVLAAAGALTYVLLTPREGEAFSEFYILGPNGKAEGYPTNLTTGGEGRLILGVVNHEHATITYTARAQWVPVDEAGNATGDAIPAFSEAVTLGDEGKWEENLTLRAPQEPGRYKLEFHLEKPGTESPYRRLHLWIQVRGNGPTD